MDADSTPALKIRLPSSMSGSSVPIRAPLTIDSDSEFCLSVNDQICSRTSSFNSSGSIDVSSYGDEHVSSVLEEDDSFVAYPDEEMVVESFRVEEHSFTRPFVKYPVENYVKNSSGFDNSAIFRAFVKIPLEESSSAVEEFIGPGVTDFGIFSPVKLGVPVAPLTSDCDSDIDSVEGRRRLSSDGIPVDGTVQAAMAPKFRVFCSYEGDDEVDDEFELDNVFSGYDIHELNEPIMGSFSAKTIEEDEHKIECLNEAVKLSEMDEIGPLCLDEQKEGDEDDTSSDSHIVPDSDNDIKIETETVNRSEQEGVFDCYGNEPKKTSQKEEQREEDEDDISFDSQRIDAQIVSGSDNEIEIETIDGIKQDGVFDCYRHKSKKTYEKEEDEQREGDENVTIFDSQRNGEIIPDLDNEIGNETMNGNRQEGVFDRFNESQKTLSENEEEMLVKMQPIRAKFLKLVSHLSLSNKDSTVAQLLHRLPLGKPLAVDANGEDDGIDAFDLSLTILVIEKTGAGKSATINSIFCENKASTDAFCPGTTTVQEIIGKIDGIRVRILDTPGLRDSPSNQSYNRKILAFVKRFTRKCTPDVVLYVDRLDTHSRDLDDSHILLLITSSLGSSVWRNCIIVLTHASYSDSLSDEPSSRFVFQRCQFIQKQIIHLRATSQQTANPVWLVENQNHLSYKHDRSWQTRFLLLCYSAKILHEANFVVEPSLNSLGRDWFEFGDFLGNVIDLDSGLEDLMVSDRVLPIEPLCKQRNGGKLSRERKKAYFEDYDFRVKVFGKNRWSLVCRLHF